MGLLAGASACLWDIWPAWDGLHAHVVVMRAAEYGLHGVVVCRDTLHAHRLCRVPRQLAEAELLEDGRMLLFRRHHDQADLSLPTEGAHSCL